MKISAIIPAAGSGSRYSKTKHKLLEPLNTMPVIVHTLKKISDIDEINEVVVCTSVELIDTINDLIKEYAIPKISKVILGGVTRQESVFIGLNNCSNPDYVLIHDGARPLITKEIIKNSINTAIEKGATIVAVPSKDTIKKVNSDLVVTDTPDRSCLWNVQTPQVFKYSELLKAHQLYKSESMTDDAALIEKMGIDVTITKGSYSNIKITTEEDLKIAQALLKFE